MHFQLLLIREGTSTHGAIHFSWKMQLKSLGTEERILSYKVNSDIHTLEGVASDTWQYLLWKSTLSGSDGCLPLRCSGPVGCESGPDRWGFLSPPSFPARWGGRAPSAPDRARSPAEPPSWEGWRPAGWGVRGTGAPLWLWDRCGCGKKEGRKRQKEPSGWVEVWQFLKTWLNWPVKLTSGFGGN